MTSTDSPSVKPKSIVVWNYEILLVLTGLFSLWNYGSISLGAMNVPDKTEASSATSAAGASGLGAVDSVAGAGADATASAAASAGASANGDVFLFTVLATAAAITILALIRLIFCQHFSKKMLHSPWLLVVFSIPIAILLTFATVLLAIGAISF